MAHPGIGLLFLLGAGIVAAVGIIFTTNYYEQQYRHNSSGSPPPTTTSWNGDRTKK